MTSKTAATLITFALLIAGLFSLPQLFAKPDFSANSPAVVHVAEPTNPHNDPAAIAQAAYDKHRPTAAAPSPAPSPVSIDGLDYTPCTTEDYEGPNPCFWDAGTRSNGEGFSFLWDGTDTTYLTVGVEACPTEDYEDVEPCLWDAGKQGNGTGHSFIWTGSERLYNVD